MADIPSRVQLLEQLTKPSPHGLDIVGRIETLEKGLDVIRVQNSSPPPLELGKEIQYERDLTWMRRCGISFQLVPFSYVSMKIKETPLQFYGVSIPGVSQTDIKFHNVTTDNKEKGIIVVEYRASVSKQTSNTSSAEIDDLFSEKRSLEADAEAETEAVKTGSGDINKLQSLLKEIGMIQKNIAMRSNPDFVKTTSVYYISKKFYYTIWTYAENKFEEFIYVSSNIGEISSESTTISNVL